MVVDSAIGLIVVSWENLASMDWNLASQVSVMLCSKVSRLMGAGLVSSGG